MAEAAIPGPAEQRLLDRLSDYHFPEPIAWWPPALGWWLLLGLAVVLGLGLIWWRNRAAKPLGRSPSPMRAHRAALEELDLIAADHHPERQLAALSRLLRRYAIYRYPTRQAAALTGQPWLEFLDRQGGNGRFSGGVGQRLADAPYRRHVEPASPELIALVRDWLRRNRPPL